MANNEVYVVDLPAMYGDHHVLEVRRLLLEMPGVLDVYASSAFHVVEVTFNPEKATPEQFINKLDEAGYLGELDFTAETGEAMNDGRSPFFRHTAVFEQTRQAVSFGQMVAYSGRPLWQCPGLGLVKKMEE